MYGALESVAVLWRLRSYRDIIIIIIIIIITATTTTLYNLQCSRTLKYLFNIVVIRCRSTQSDVTCLKLIAAIFEIDPKPGAFQPAGANLFDRTALKKTWRSFLQRCSVGHAPYLLSRVTALHESKIDSKWLPANSP